MPVKLHLVEALGLLGRTMPFIWVRLGSYLVLGLALGVYFAVLGGVAWLLGALWAPLGWLVFLVAAGGAFGVVRWATRYYFYLLKAAHTAVMTEIIVHGRAPEGSQVEYGRKQVLDRFKDTSILFGVDVLVDGVTKAITRTVGNIANLLPIPGLRNVTNLLERIAVASTTFVDEAVLSRAYARREQNVWQSAHDGVVLYAQAWRPILLNATVLTLLGYAEFVLLLVVIGVPAVGLGAVFPALKVALGIGVILLSWMIKLAVGDAFALATTLLAYHRATEHLEVDEEWKARLEGMSDKFRELGQKAASAVRGTVPAQAARAAAPSGANPTGSDDAADLPGPGLPEPNA